MQQSDEDMFYLMSDLNDALVDLLIALHKWHTELEKSLLEADKESALAAMQEIQSVLEKIPYQEK